jgi:hypothetical protein
MGLQGNSEQRDADVDLGVQDGGVAAPEALPKHAVQRLPDRSSLLLLRLATIPARIGLLDVTMSRKCLADQNSMCQVVGSTRTAG